MSATEKIVTLHLPQGVIDWLKDGHRGISSEAIVSHLYGLPMRWGEDHPSDAGDVIRCIKLLEASPDTRDRFSEMQFCSLTWARYVHHWDELEALYRDGDWDAMYALCRYITGREPLRTVGGHMDGGDVA